MTYAKAPVLVHDRIVGKRYRCKDGKVRRWDGKQFVRYMCGKKVPDEWVESKDRIVGQEYISAHGEKGVWYGKRLRPTKERINEYMRERLENPEKYRRSQQYMIKCMYGLTPDAYIDLFKTQNYCCRICDKDVQPSTREACVDHKPGTGYINLPKGKRKRSGIPAHVRGILCDHCNRGLVYIERNASFGQRALEYLNTYN